MPLTDNQKKSIDIHILLAVRGSTSTTNEEDWTFRKNADWRFAFNSMSPREASMFIRYILNQHPTRVQKDTVQKYLDVELSTELGVSLKKIKSNCRRVLNIRRCLFGSQDWFNTEPPLWKVIGQDESEVYEYVKFKLRGYLEELGFANIPINFETSSDIMYLEIKNNIPFSENSSNINKIKNITEVTTSVSFKEDQDWIPPFMRRCIVEPRLLSSTLNSIGEFLQSSVTYAVDLLKEWHEYRYQDMQVYPEKEISR